MGGKCSHQADLNKDYTGVDYPFADSTENLVRLLLFEVY